MTRVGKLHAWVLANPRASIAFRDFETLLAAHGFSLVRIAGSHRQYAHPDIPLVFSIQPRGKEAKSYQIAQFLAICSEHGLTLE